MGAPVKSMSEDLDQPRGPDLMHIQLAVRVSRGKKSSTGRGARILHGCCTALHCCCTALHGLFLGGTHRAASPENRNRYSRRFPAQGMRRDFALAGTLPHTATTKDRELDRLLSVKNENHAWPHLMQIQFAACVSCGNAVKHRSYGTGTARVLYRYGTGLLGCTVFLFRRFLGPDSVVGNLAPVGRFVKTRVPFFRVTRFLHGCHTAPTRAYTVSSGRSGGNIQRLPRLRRVGQEKPVKRAAFVAEDGGQVEEIIIR